MKTLQVFVCENGEKCALCANAPDTPTSSWAKLHCETGLLRGNQIKLKNPSSHVDFCEIYVIGKSKSFLMFFFCCSFRLFLILQHRDFHQLSLLDKNYKLQNNVKVV